MAVNMHDDRVPSAASASAGAGFPAAAGSRLERVSCCLCGSDDEKVLFQAADKMFNDRRETFTTVRCRNCGLVYLNPRPKSGEDARYYAGGYRFSAGNPEQSQPLGHYRPVIDFLDADGPGRLLDVGTGNSPLLPAMRERGWEVSGTEVDQALVDYFRSRHQIELFRGELAEAGFDDEYFTAITIMGVLEHVPDPRLLLEEAARILKRGGTVALWCFNRSVEAAVLGRYWLGFDAPRHLYSFSRATLGRLLLESGLEPVNWRFSPVNYLAYSGVWATKRARDRLRGRSRPIYLGGLPAGLELLGLPLGKLLAALKKSSNM
ncbi:MAG: class I SAM-dependent methyltransferase, partial [Actinomycetota bacterium]